MSILHKSKNIIDEYSLHDYLDVLLDYLKENPVDPGHDFSHFLASAYYAFEIGENHDYPIPQELFCAMLFHDIYRPSHGEDAKEDQTEGAEIVKSLFDRHNLEDEIADIAVSFIKKGEIIKTGKKPPNFIIIMGIADMIEMNSSRADSYVWASNNYLKNKYGKVKYRKHLDTVYSFSRFQVDKWTFMMNAYKKWKYPEALNAMESYMKVLNNSINLHFESEEEFEKYLENQVSERKILEENNLKFFLGDEVDVGDYLVNFS